MMRKGLRRGTTPQARQPKIPPKLRRANQLMAAGNYIAAAEAFEQVGRAWETRGVKRSASMFLQAGRARILAGQKDVGIAHLKHGLESVASTGRVVWLAKAGNRVVAELNQKGMTTEAQEIANWLQATIPPTQDVVRGISAGMNATPAKKVILPTHCPSCGGSIIADDVEWLDEITAECNWCGNPIRAES
ncbi:MAG: hypothetical protein C4583_11010 [Anaerolineaceae bacterium]|nr:MAG: hypothetical protein C4583_11010 [Anaerolineaceae bacterium]